MNRPPPVSDILVTTRPVVCEGWRRRLPRTCPVIVLNEKRESVPCWETLSDGACIVHGRIYKPYKAPPLIEEALAAARQKSTRHGRKHRLTFASE